MKLTKGMAGCLFALGVGTTAAAQSAADQSNIKSLCGCYEVEFKYNEVSAPDPAYKFSKPYTAHGLEWVEPIEQTPGKFSLQHLLIVKDTSIVKHWREDWVYQNTELLHFKDKGVWDKFSLKPADAKGQWTQSVWEVDDAPRYQGSAKWVNKNGNPAWINATDAPLPRREYTTRSDYNVMNRTNTIIINKEGWVHEQDNKKILRTAEGDKLIAVEKGYNIYRRTDDSKCAAAKRWWAKNQAEWVEVRKDWAAKIAESKGEVHL